MGSMLASDLNNPEYAGASNPDSRLAVRFYKRPLQNEYKSQQAGRPIFDEVDFVEIRVPGDTTFALDVPARQDHKDRFPMHWARYMNSHGADGTETGTALEAWPRLSRAQVEELKALKFRTVEQIASAADAQLQRIGMIAGMSPYAFREAAQRFLKLADNDSAHAEAEEKAKALETQLAESARAIDELRAEMAAMKAERKKPGPKPKETAE
jgi:hypothetical protein